MSVSQEQKSKPRFTEMTQMKVGKRPSNVCPILSYAVSVSSPTVTVVIVATEGMVQLDLVCCCLFSVRVPLILELAV